MLNITTKHRSRYDIVSERIREIVAEKGISLYKLQLSSGLSKGTFTSLIYIRYKSVNLTTLITIIEL